MNSRDYIEKRISDLALKFTGIRIRYEHRDITQSHIIEILPLDLYESNTEYLLEEELIEKEFSVLFPDENILFVSEGSLTELTCVDFELGYKEVLFDNEASSTFFDVFEFTNEVETSEINYALAA
jgi:hypothetical protein